jgi:hypothetical protein
MWMMMLLSFKPEDRTNVYLQNASMIVHIYMVQRPPSRTSVKKKKKNHPEILKPVVDYTELPVIPRMILQQQTIT